MYDLSGEMGMNLLEVKGRGKKRFKEDEGKKRGGNYVKGENLFPARTRGFNRNRQGE